jgi:hypothetical protein
VDEEENEQPDKAQLPPLTLLAASAVAHHELYQTYMSAGFSEQRAFEILKLVMYTGLLKNM